MEHISDRIKRARDAQGMTLKEISDLIGVSEATFSRYEGGHIGNIPSSRIEKIAEFLKVTPGYLMGWEDKEPLESVEKLIEDFPEGIRMIRRASKELSPKDRERLIKIMKSYLDQEDGE